MLFWDCYWYYNVKAEKREYETKENYYQMGLGRRITYGHCFHDYHDRGDDAADLAFK